MLTHAKNPCSHLKDFVPDTEGKTYLFYLRMDTKTDFTTWSNVARCFRMWDLDARGFHKSTWRFWIKKNHILAVGCPASEYCKNKPQELEPIYYPTKKRDQRILFKLTSSCNDRHSLLKELSWIMSKTGSQYEIAAFMPRGARRKLKLASKNYNTSGHTIF